MWASMFACKCYFELFGSCSCDMFQAFNQNYSYYVKISTSPSLILTQPVAHSNYLLPYVPYFPYFCFLFLLQWVWGNFHCIFPVFFFFHADESSNWNLRIPFFQKFCCSLPFCVFVSLCLYLLFCLCSARCSI